MDGEWVDNKWKWRTPAAERPSSSPSPPPRPSKPPLQDFPNHTKFYGKWVDGKWIWHDKPRRGKLVERKLTGQSTSDVTQLFGRRSKDYDDNDKSETLSRISPAIKRNRMDSVERELYDMHLSRDGDRSGSNVADTKPNINDMPPHIQKMIED